MCGCEKLHEFVERVFFIKMLVECKKTGFYILNIVKTDFYMKFIYFKKFKKV